MEVFDKKQSVQIYFKTCYTFETESNRCNSNPCQHGAECTGDINTFSCDCDSEHTGTLCEIGIFDFCVVLTFFVVLRVQFIQVFLLQQMNEFCCIYR